MLEADAEADQRGRRPDLAFGGVAGPPLEGALHAAEAGRVHDQAARLADGLRVLGRAPGLERDDRAGARVADARHAWMRGEALGERSRACLPAREAGGERSQPAEGEVRLQRAGRRPAASAPVEEPLLDGGIAPRPRRRAADRSGRRSASSRSAGRGRRRASSGVCPKGVANVLSTTTRAPAARATAITPGRSTTSSIGLVGDSTQTSAAPRNRLLERSRGQRGQGGERELAAAAAFAELLRDAEVGRTLGHDARAGRQLVEDRAAGGEPRGERDAAAVLERAQGLLERLPAGVAVAAVHRLAAVVIRRGGDDRRVQRRGRSPRRTAGDHGDRLGMQWLIGHGFRAVSRAAARRAGPSAARWRPRRRRSGRAPAPPRASPARPAPAAARRRRSTRPTLAPKAALVTRPTGMPFYAHRLAAQGLRRWGRPARSAPALAARPGLARGDHASRPMKDGFARCTVKPRPASSACARGACRRRRSGSPSRCAGLEGAEAARRQAVLGSPASSSRSHVQRPYSVGTYSSQPSSPA